MMHHLAAQGNRHCVTLDASHLASGSLGVDTQCHACIVSQQSTEQVFNATHNGCVKRSVMKMGVASQRRTVTERVTYTLKLPVVVWMKHVLILAIMGTHDDIQCETWVSMKLWSEIQTDQVSRVVCHVLCVTCCVSRVVCHVLCVTCCVSRVVCHVLCVTCCVLLRAQGSRCWFPLSQNRSTKGVQGLVTWNMPSFCPTNKILDLIGTGVENVWVKVTSTFFIRWWCPHYLRRCRAR